MSATVANKYDEVFERCGIKSEKQKRFIIEYFNTDFNAAEAIRLAGYQTKWDNRMGHEMLQKPHIKEAVKAICDMQKDKTSIKEDYVVRTLKYAMERAKDDNNLNALLRGVEIAARSLGMFTDKTEITGKDGNAIAIEQRTEEDAAAFARAIASLTKRRGAEEVAGDTKH